MAELKQISKSFMTQQQRLNHLLVSYESYHTIDRQENTSLHDKAFLVWFCALAIQQRSVLDLMSLGTPDQIEEFSQTENINNNGNKVDFDVLLRSVIHPNTLVKIGYSTTYLRLISDEHTGSVLSNDTTKQLSVIAKNNIEAYYRKLEANKSLILDILKTATRID